MTERYEKSPAKAGLFEWSAVHSVVAGMAGFEPADDGVKVRCLTPWLHPNMLIFLWTDTKIRKAFALRTEKSIGGGNRVRTDDLQGHNLAL